jgi:tight adherence protein B
MMEPTFVTTLVIALVAGAGVFLVFIGLALPPSVRLEKPEKGLLAGLQRRLDAAELPVTAGEFVTTCGVFGAVVAGLAVLLGAPVLALVGLVLAPVILWQRYEAQRDRFRQEYNESLAETVQLLREGFSATGSLRDALHHVVRNGLPPAVVDFEEVWSAQATGIDLEDAFAPVIERRRNPYLRMVAEALALKASEGGNVGQVLLGLETMIREQVYLRQEIEAKQSQARLESTIVSLSPFFFFLAIKLLPWMREYELGFYHTFLGQIVLAVAAAFSVTSFFMARRIATRGLTLEVKEVTA